MPIEVADLGRKLPLLRFAEIEDPGIGEGPFHYDTGEVDPPLAAIDDGAVRRSDHVGRDAQQVVGPIGQIDPPWRLPIGDDLEDQSLQSAAIGDGSIHVPDDLGAAGFRKEISQELDCRSSGMDPAVVGTHGGQVSHGAVPGQQKEATRQGCLESQQHVVSIDYHGLTPQCDRLEPFSPPFEAVRIAGRTALQGFALPVAKCVAITDQLESGPA